VLRPDVQIKVRSVAGGEENCIKLEKKPLESFRASTAYGGMKAFLDFYSLALFIIVARAGGLGAAERDTGIPKATLSRRLCALEAALNVQLFRRTGRGVVLTARGERLYSRSLVGFEMAEKAVEEICDEASLEAECGETSANLLNKGD
jgi:hypothetical protein